MILQVFAVLDSKAGAFAQPFFSPTIFTAQRLFADACADSTTLLAKHPEDYSLYHLGSFDDGSGFIDPLAKPENIGTAASLTRA